MFKFKNLAICLSAVFFIVPMAFAEGEGVIKTDEGYVYETTIGSLFNKGISDEIKLVNTSSYELPFITCVVTIGGKSHDMRPMPLLKLGDFEGFDGYFSDNMSKEFLKQFGRDGRFSKKNNTIVKFTFKFKDHANDVAITDVYGKQDDLCFVVSDIVTEESVVNEQSVADVAESEQTQPESSITKEQEQAKQEKEQPKQKESKQELQPQAQPAQVKSPASSGDEVIVIGGKTYILHDGKAYLLQ